MWSMRWSTNSSTTSSGVEGCVRGNVIAPTAPSPAIHTSIRTSRIDRTQPVDATPVCWMDANSSSSASAGVFFHPSVGGRRSPEPRRPAPSAQQA